MYYKCLHWSLTKQSPLKMTATFWNLSLPHNYRKPQISISARAWSLEMQNTIPPIHFQKYLSQLNPQPALPIFSIYNFFICDWMTEKGLTIFSHSSLTLNEVSPIFIWHVFYSVITRNRYWCDSFNFTAQWAGETVNRVQNIWQRNSLGHH